MGCQKESWRKLREIILRNIHIDIDALVLGMDSRPGVWKNHMGSGLQRMGQGFVGKEVAFFYFCRFKLCQLFKASNTLRQSCHRSRHDRFTSRHKVPLEYFARKIVAAIHVRAHIVHEFRLLFSVKLQPLWKAHGKNG